MTAKITPSGLRLMLLAAADAIIREEPRLNALDSAVGDGDHGITMRLGCEAVKKRLGELDAASGFDTLLQESGLHLRRDWRSLSASSWQKCSWAPASP